MEFDSILSDDKMGGDIIPEKYMEDDVLGKSKMSEKGILNLINDIFLTNYWCTRKNMINITSDYMINLDKLIDLIKKFRNVKFDDINYIGHSYFTQQSYDKLDNGTISLFLKKHSRPVYDILNIGNGKISLCGGAIISILRCVVPNDYDLFFHSDSIDEVDNIFNSCLNYLDNLNETSATYSRSQYIMNITLSRADFYGDIQFIKRVYKTKEQILFSFDLAPCRFGYNPKDGIFATICGAMALSMNAFALDSSVRSTSFGYRLDKYCFRKEYRVLLPQLENNLIADDIIDIFDDIKLVKDNNISKNFRIRSFDGKNDDYVSNDDNINYLIDGNYNSINFSSDKLQIISELPYDFIETEMRNKTKLFDKPSSVDHTNRKEAKRFLSDRYKEFALSYFIEENDTKADAIWEEKTQYYIEEAKKCAKNIKDNSDKNYYKGWKYLNPGQKYFGQNNPINTPPSKYYKPLEIGINMNRFQAFMDCRKNIEYIFNLPKELFGLICEYWLKYEADDAKNRLFKLKIKPIMSEPIENDELELILPGW